METYCPPIFAAILSHILFDVSAISPSYNFSLTSQCVDRSCIQASRLKSRGRLECAAACGHSSGCAGFTQVSDGTCYHLQDGCFLNSTCSQYDVELRAYTRPKHVEVCLNGGTWHDQPRSCTCVNGWVDNRCQRLPYTCKELNTFRYPSGNHIVSIDVYRNMTRIVHTRCDIGSGWHRTFIFANDGTVDNNRTWNDYVTGFDYGQWNSWLGLDNLRAYNMMGHVTVSMGVVMQNSKFMWDVVYNNFHVQDGRSGYAFSCDYSSNMTYGIYNLRNQYALDRVLILSQGLPFSAFDMDQVMYKATNYLSVPLLWASGSKNNGFLNLMQDSDRHNCAALYGAGWWLDECTSDKHVNPLGFFPRDGQSSTALNNMWLPGINTSDPEFKDNFQSVLLTFID